MPAILAPRLWLGHVVALVLIAIAVMLGWWQVEAWQTRRADAARDLTQAEPVALAELMGPDDPFPGRSVGQPVELAGSWVADATVFISDREHDRDEGFWMVTPLAIGGEGQPAMPVVVGWVADPGEAPAAPTGSAELEGWLQPPEGTGARDPDPTDDILPRLRIADLVQRVDQDLYSAYVVAHDGIGGLRAGDLEQLPTTGRFTALRNLLYALEWWVFGAFAGLIWWRWVQEQTAREEDLPAADDEDQPDTVAG